VLHGLRCLRTRIDGVSLLTNEAKRHVVGRDTDAILSGWFLAIPAITFCFLSLGALGLASGALQHKKLDSAVALLLAPAVLALLSAPGYLYGFATQHRWTRVGRNARLWIYSSLACGALAAAGATIASIPTGIGPILSVWSLALAVIFTLRFRRQIKALRMHNGLE
jgi:hypothetical protein